MSAFKVEETFDRPAKTVAIINGNPKLNDFDHPELLTICEFENGRKLICRTCDQTQVLLLDWQIDIYVKICARHGLHEEEDLFNLSTELSQQIQQEVAVEFERRKEHFLSLQKGGRQMLPSLHGGHSVIDNHRLGECGLKASDYETNWLLARCQNCVAKKWCYNIERPVSHNSAVEQLVAIYKCNLEIAKSKGISPFSLLVHLPLPEDFAKVITRRYNAATYREARWSMPEEDLPIFVEAIKILQSLEPQRISVAVEVDYLPDSYSNANILAHLLQVLPDTIVVGSVHMFEIDGELFMAGKNGNNVVQTQNFIDRRGIEEFWTAVLKHSLRLASLYPIDILGHLFVFQKYLPKCPITPTTIQLAQLIAEELVRRQILIDINTSGLMKGIHKDDPYFPSYWLQLFQNAGVQFVTGDDSHGPKQIGQGFQVCKEFLLQNGVKKLSILYKVDGKKYFRPFDL